MKGSPQGEGSGNCDSCCISQCGALFNVVGFTSYNINFLKCAFDIPAADVCAVAAVAVVAADW